MSVFWGTSFHTNPHRHETLQLVFDIEKTFLLKDESTEWTSYSAAIIKASHIHQLDSNESIQLFVYLDRDSEYAQKLTKKYLSNQHISSLENSGIKHISSGFFKRLLVVNDCDELFKGCMTILSHLVRFDKPIKRDDRIIQAVSFITHNQDRKFKIKDVANFVCLSESRLRFLFKKQVGQPIQNFMVWMKVVNSLNKILKGSQLTQTAYDVGFWDASHMNRSYKELLGVAPSMIRKFEKDLRIISCGNSNFYTFKTEILENWDSKAPFKTIEI